ncbi:transposase [Bacteroidia bacterium]|nr:transposase [Bacteroidia bacterium]
MATYSVYFRKDRIKAGKDSNVTIQIIHNREISNVNTGLNICSEQVDKDMNIIDDDFLTILLNVRKKYKKIVDDEFGDDLQQYSCKEIKSLIEKKTKLKKEKKGIDFIQFAKEYIQEMRKEGREKTASLLEKSIRGFMDFIKKDEIDCNDITYSLLMEFSNFLKSERKITRKSQFGKEYSMTLEGLNDYGVSKYFIDLRSIYYAAMKRYNDDDQDDNIIKRNPFKKLEIKRNKHTEKRNISIADIRNIMNTPDSSLLRANFARDVFMLSFMFSGMNPIDLYNVDEFKNGRISYNRHKTKSRRDDAAYISIKVEPEVMTLFEKYRDKTGEKVFNFHNLYCDPHGFDTNLNKGLKYIQKQCNIERHLTMYVARHSWATIARNDLHISKDDIAECLNHVDTTHAVTDIYIEKDFNVIDRANRKMVEYLFER